jgi:hypothetical protein
MILLQENFPVQNKYMLSVSLVICSSGLGKGDSGSGGASSWGGVSLVPSLDFQLTRCTCQ